MITVNPLAAQAPGPSGTKTDQGSQVHRSILGFSNFFGLHQELKESQVRPVQVCLELPTFIILAQVLS